jgi:hypothetical protein
MNRYGVGRDYSELRSPIMATSQHGYASASRRGYAYKGMGITPATVQSIEYAAKKAGAIDRALGVTKGIGNGLKCDAAIPLVGKEISNIMNAITKTTLGLSGPAEKRAFFRLGELFAKADPKVRAKGWAYAGYGNNTVNVADQEGAAFKTRTGRQGRILGLEGHLAPAEFLGIRTEIGRRCELLNIMKSVLETAVRVRGVLDSIPDIVERKFVFSDLLGHYLAGSSWQVGVVDQISPSDIEPFLMMPNPDKAALNAALEVINQPRVSPERATGGTDDLGFGGPGDKKKDEEEGVPIAAIAAIAAAAVGAYFLTQG